MKNGAAAGNAVSDIIAFIDSIAIMIDMSTLTIRRLPDGVKERLRVRAAEHGRSMEAEARAILEEALPAGPAVDLAWVNACIAIGERFGGTDLDIPPRAPARVPDFSRDDHLGEYLSSP